VISTKAAAIIIFLFMAVILKNKYTILFST
jgi:hypothetical protein